MNPSYVRFYKDRKKAKKCGKVIMYIGFFLVIVNSISMFFKMLNVFGVYLDGGKRFRDLKMFTAGQLALGYVFEIIYKGVQVYLGYKLIKSTKIVLKQISAQEMNPRFAVDKHGETVRKEERTIALSMIIYVALTGLVGIYWYVMLDSHLESTYKDEYLQWKAMTLKNDTSSLSD